MEELVKKAKNGDQQAFIELVLSVQKELYSIAKIKIKNEEDILDVLQETMLDAFKNIGKLRENKYFRTWIVKILINKCNSVYKFSFRKQDSFEDGNFENYALTEEKNEKLEFDILIKNLKSEEKTILTLYYYLRFTTLEISKILKIREGTVRSKISRAKEKIRKQYKGGIENE